MSSRSKTAAIAEVFACCLVLPVIIAVTIICTVIPIYLLVVGIVKINDCSVDQRIPIWMISLACLILLERILGSLSTVIDRRWESENEKPSDVLGVAEMREWEERRSANRPMVLTVINAVLRLGVTVTTIVGCVFVFSAYSGRDKCDGLLFYSAFVYCIIFLALLAVAILFICCACLCLCVGVALNGN